VIGASIPASAQIQLSGVWNPRTHEDQPDRGPGPDLGDYTGLPINDAARLFAESWDASRLTLQEHQCRVHVAPYIFHGPLRLGILLLPEAQGERAMVDVGRNVHATLVFLQGEARGIPAFGEESCRVIDRNPQVVTEVRSRSAILFVFVVPKRVPVSCQRDLRQGRHAPEDHHQEE